MDPYEALLKCFLQEEKDWRIIQEYEDIEANIRFIDEDADFKAVFNEEMRNEIRLSLQATMDEFLYG